MNTHEALERLKKFYADVPVEGRRTDGPDEFRTDHATGLSLRDIQGSEASKDVKFLLEMGFKLSGGEMTVIIINHEPTPEKEGRFIYELAGQPAGYGARTGVELHIFYLFDGNVTNINVTPSFKMLGAMGDLIPTENLFESMIHMTQDEMLQNAGVLIQLGAKAVGVEPTA